MQPPAHQSQNGKYIAIAILAILAVGIWKADRYPLHDFGILGLTEKEYSEATVIGDARMRKQMRRYRIDPCSADLIFYPGTHDWHAFCRGCSTQPVPGLFVPLMTEILDEIEFGREARTGKKVNEIHLENVMRRSFQCWPGESHNLMGRINLLQDADKPVPKDKLAPELLSYREIMEIHMDLAKRHPCDTHIYFYNSLNDSDLQHRLAIAGVPSEGEEEFPMTEYIAQEIRKYNGKKTDLSLHKYEEYRRIPQILREVHQVNYDQCKAQ